MRHLAFLLLSFVCVAFSAHGQEMPAPPAAAAPVEDGQWTAPAKNYANTRYSGLNEINTGNVGKLQVAFSFSMGVDRGQESAPLVVGSTLYVVSPFPNFLYALDLNKPGAPLKWKYDPKPDASAQGVACCDVVNRGPTYADGKLFLVTLQSRCCSRRRHRGRALEGQAR